MTKRGTGDWRVTNLEEGCSADELFGMLDVKTQIYLRDGQSKLSGFKLLFHSCGRGVITNTVV